ncbi:MAG: TRASH domain protein [Thermodesulfobacteriota bacterium]
MKPIIILLIVFLVIRYLRKSFIAKLQREREAEERGGGPQQAAGEEMVLDPVCNSYVPVSTAVSVRTGEGVEYFCSEECRDKFLA